MKKIIALLLFNMAVMMSWAGCKLVSGNVMALRNAGHIEVTCDWNNAAFKKGGKLQDFLWLSARSTKWEEVCIKEFANEASSYASEVGIRFVPVSEAKNAKFKLSIVTYSISGGGDIKGNLVITPIGETQGSPITISFSSDEADDDDYTAFGEQFESIGKALGKLLAKQIK